MEVESAETTLIEEKIDQLTSLAELQSKRIEALERHNNGNALLLERIEAINQHLMEQRRRQEELDELKADLIPIANQLVKLSIDELAEISQEFQLEDLLFFIKRLLRDMPLLMQLLEGLEGTIELLGELQVIGNRVFHETVVQLDRMERQGYFAFAQEGWHMVDRIVKEFSEEDAKALGDNIITILTTVRNLTQPAIMTLTNNALQAITNESSGDENVTFRTLLRDLSDPKVRRGMARLLNLLRVLADQPAALLN